MKHTSFIAFPFLLLLANVVGCSSAAPTPPGQSTDALWGEHARSIEVTQADGFVAHPKGNECSGQSFTYDAKSKKLHGELCDQGKKIPAVDRVLKDDEVNALDTKLKGLAKAATSDCAADASVIKIKVTDDTNTTTSYVDANNACNGTKDTPIDVASANALVTELSALATVAGPNATAMWDAHSRSIAVTRRGGLPTVECLEESYSYDAPTKKLRGAPCDDQDKKLPAFDRTLGDDEVTALTSALTSVAIAPVAACQQIADAVIMSAGVTDDASVTTTYVDLNVCGRAGTLVDEKGAAALLKELRALAAVATPAPWNAHSRSLSVTWADGNVVRPAGADCFNESFTYDASTKKIHGEQCDKDHKKLPAVDRDLSADEVTALTGALGKVAISAKPSCVTDIPVIRVTVTDDANQPHAYVDEKNTCDVGNITAIDTASAEALLAELRTLTAK